MAQEIPLTWTRLLNGIGSAIIAYLVVFLLFVFVTGPLGPVGTVVVLLSGALLAALLYVFFERL